MHVLPPIIALVDGGSGKPRCFGAAAGWPVRGFGRGYESGLVGEYDGLDAGA
jgi:hypothetical protein